MVPGFAAAWLLQRAAGNVALEAVNATELRNLTDAEALKRTDALLAIGAASARSPEREQSSGFVQQQRLFARARR